MTRVYNGNQTLFWRDRWLGEESLIHKERPEVRTSSRRVTHQF